jgi:hypothetical protein
MMAKVKWFLGRKAARATVRHTAHGMTAKVKRQPLRSAKLVSVGAAVGAAAGFLAGRGNRAT